MTILRNTSLLAVVALTFVAKPASADHLRDLECQAKETHLKIDDLSSEFDLAFRRTYEYRYLASTATRMCQLTDRIRKTAACNGSLRQIECDIRDVQRLSARVNYLLDNVDYASRRAASCRLSSYTPCSTAHARTILSYIDDCLCKMDKTVDAIIRGPYLPPVPAPVRYQPPRDRFEVRFDHRQPITPVRCDRSGVSLGLNGFSIRFSR